MQLDKDEIKRVDQDTFFDQNNQPATLTPISIFFSVLAAIIVAWLLEYSFERYQMAKAIQQLNVESEAFNQQIKKEIERMSYESKKQIQQHQSLNRLRNEMRREAIQERQHANPSTTQLQKKPQPQINYEYKQKTCELTNDVPPEIVCKEAN